METKEVVRILKEGGIGVLPTDTLYGLVGLALDKKAVERIYKVRERTPGKPMIVLISSLKDLELFGVKTDIKTQEILQKYWPGKVSIVLPLPCRSPAKAVPSPQKQFVYLHRETETIAFRWPKNKALLEILKATGPLVAPSANPEGLEPAKTINEAKKYFGDKVDFYLPGKMTNERPSTLISIENGEIKILRSGAVKIKK